MRFRGGFLTPPSLPTAGPKPNVRRGNLSKRVRQIREIIREVAGLAPYEKRVLDVIKVR